VGWRADKVKLWATLARVSNPLRTTKSDMGKKLCSHTQFADSRRRCLTFGQTSVGQKPATRSPSVQDSYLNANRR